MRNISNLLRLLCITFLALVYGCSKGNGSGPGGPKIQPGGRIIQFSGYDWEVRSSGSVQQGPGPNYFSDSLSNVWVDSDGRLHLKITKRKGIWYAAEVTLKKPCGYGRFMIQMDSPLEILDRNVVGAMFLYKNDEEEMDIEFSKWGIENNQNAQFAIQPAGKTGNKFRFQFGDNIEKQSVHVIDWRKEAVHFAVYNSSIADTSNIGSRVSAWTYTGVDNPAVQDMRFKLNLWLFKGMVPDNREEQEIVISKFEML